MIIEIECYKGDLLLSGKKVSFTELKEQIKTVEKLYDKQEDNFTEMFCRMYEYNIVSEQLLPDYVYDRDTKEILQKYGQ